MSSQSRFAMMLSIALFLSLILSSNCLPTKKIDTTIRASNCVSNATHCHCSMVQAKSEAVCLKPIANSIGRCTKGSCAAGYKCDCDSNLVCMKQTVTAYSTTDKSSAMEVICTQSQPVVPKTVVVHTSDFHVIAFQEFQLFVNNDQVGFAQSNDYQVFTAELRSGDVVAVQARRLSKDKYGVKLRFQDLQLETRFIDENWYSSSTYDASWLDKSFDAVAAGWTHPSIASTVTDDGFDKDVPWMWNGASEIMYARYVIP